MKKHLFPLILIVLTIVVWIIAFPYLPSQIATHWDLSGNVNGYTSKVGALLTMVGLLVLLYVLFTFLPKIDPKNKNYKYFMKSYKFITNAMLLMIFTLNLLTILYSLGYPIPMSTITPIIVGVIFIVLGNFLQTVRTNYFIGIRTPWTLSNEEIWRKTHRFGGKAMFWAGVVIVISSFLPAYWMGPIMTTSIILSVGLPIFYSYLLFKKGTTTK